MTDQAAARRAIIADAITADQAGRPALLSAASYAVLIDRFMEQRTARGQAVAALEVELFTDWLNRNLLAGSLIDAVVAGEVSLAIEAGDLIVHTLRDESGSSARIETLLDDMVAQRFGSRALSEAGQAVVVARLGLAEFASPSDAELDELIGYADEAAANSALIDLALEQPMLAFEMTAGEVVLRTASRYEMPVTGALLVRDLGIEPNDQAA